MPPIAASSDLARGGTPRAARNQAEANAVVIALQEGQYVAHFSQHRRRYAAAAIVAALGLAGAPGTHASAAKNTQFVRYNAATHTATIHLIAAYDATAAGFNFDGGAHGAVTIIVPLNTKVVATFVNNATTAHSALIVNNSKTFSAKTPAPAFKGAASADYLNGAEKGDPATTFRFTANKAGTYLLICGVPGHDSAGMWDTFVISPTAKTVTFRRR
jgi:sulfocyanin